MKVGISVVISGMKREIANRAVITPRDLKRIFAMTRPATYAQEPLQADDADGEDDRVHETAHLDDLGQAVEGVGVVPEVERVRDELRRLDLRAGSSTSASRQACTSRGADITRPMTVATTILTRLVTARR